jgi:hypothetical protein
MQRSPARWLCRIVILETVMVNTRLNNYIYIKTHLETPIAISLPSLPVFFLRSKSYSYHYDFSINPPFPTSIFPFALTSISYHFPSQMPPCLLWVYN